ncbi:MAG: hypothetical protein JXQ99_05170 [Hyphomicrobiaceae bacterium]
MPDNTQGKISDSEARAFVLSAIALSAGIFNIAFWYGVFETVFFEHLFYIWVAATVALVASMLVPPVDALPAFVSWRGRFVLLLPTVWLILEAAWAGQVVGGDDRLLWVVSIAVVVLTLPYIVCVLVLVAVPDVEQLRAPKLRVALVAFALATAVAGVAIGQNHPLFLTCTDFKVAGDDVPPNCRKDVSR